MIKQFHVALHSHPLPTLYTSVDGLALVLTTPDLEGAGPDQDVFRLDSRESFLGSRHSLSCHTLPLCLQNSCPEAAHQHVTEPGPVHADPGFLSQTSAPLPSRLPSTGNLLHTPHRHCAGGLSFSLFCLLSSHLGSAAMRQVCGIYILVPLRTHVHAALGIASPTAQVLES